MLLQSCHCIEGGCYFKAVHSIGVHDRDARGPESRRARAAVVVRSRKLVAFLELVNERAILVVTHHAVMVAAGRVLDGEHPLEEIVTHDGLEVAPGTEVEDVLARVGADDGERVHGTHVSADDGEAVNLCILLLAAGQGEWVGDPVEVAGRAVGGDADRDVVIARRPEDIDVCYVLEDVLARGQGHANREKEEQAGQRHDGNDAAVDRLALVDLPAQGVAGRGQANRKIERAVDGELEEEVER